MGGTFSHIPLLQFALFGCIIIMLFGVACPRMRRKASAYGEDKGKSVMINIAIVEDNAGELGQLRECIDRYAKEHGETFSVTSFSDGLAFLDKYGHGYDIIFMDINMPYESGLGIAKRLRVIDPDVCLIFVTQMAQYAINAYDVNARDYILKPVVYSAFAFRFEKAIASVRAAVAAHNYIFVKTQKGMVRIDVNDIYYIEVIRHMVIYHMTDRNIESWESLKNVESALGALAGSQFVRCNNCFLVNLRYVDKAEGDTVYIGREQLKMSRARRKEFLNAFTLYLGG